MRRKPVQARSRNTLEVILEAAAQILEREGRAALSTNAVAERAGVAIATLYQYFPNRDAILVAMARVEIAAHREAVLRVVSGALELAPDELVPAVVRSLIAVFARRQNSRRMARETLIGYGLQHELSAGLDDLAALLAANAARMLPNAGGEVSPASMFVLVRAVSGVLGEAHQPAASGAKPSELEFELVRLIRAYLAALACA